MTMARANWRAVHGNTARSIMPSRKWTCQSSGRRIVIVSGATIGVTLVGTFLNKARIETDDSDALAVDLLDLLLEGVGRGARQRAAIAVAAGDAQPQPQPPGARRRGV